MSNQFVLRRVDYGVDAPQVVRRLFLSGFGVIILSAVSAWLLPDSPHFAVPILISGLISGGSLVVTAAGMTFGSKVLKLRFRDRVLNGLNLCGNETVLDLGCGRGLFLIGAASRLTTGQAVGVDLWQTQDQAGNHPDRTLENARAARVAERVEIVTGDMRQLPFADGSFDVVVSSWAIHNVYGRPGREQVIREIVRVLKPGGQVAIIDIRHAAEYAVALAGCSMHEVRSSRPYFLFVVPSRIVTARNPGALTSRNQTT